MNSPANFSSLLLPFFLFFSLFSYLEERKNKNNSDFLSSSFFFLSFLFCSAPLSYFFFFLLFLKMDYIKRLFGRESKKHYRAVTSNDDISGDTFVPRFLINAALGGGTESGMMSGEDKLNEDGLHPMKKYGTIIRARFGFPKGLLFVTSLVAWAYWAIVHLLGTIPGIFPGTEQEIDNTYPTVVVVAPGDPSWIDMVTHGFLAAGFLYILNEFVSGNKSDTPFVTNQAFATVVFAMNGISAQLWYWKKYYLPSAILLSVSLFLVICIYWYRRTMHYIRFVWNINNDRLIAMYKDKNNGKEPGRLTLWQLRSYLVRPEHHHVEPVDDMEYIFTEVPLKLLVVWTAATCIFRWFVYSMITYNNQVFNGSVSLDNIIISMHVILVFFTVVFNVGLRWDGIFGILVLFYELYSGTTMATFQNNSSYLPSILCYVWTLVLAITSFPTTIWAYRQHRQTWYSNGLPDMAEMRKLVAED